METRSRLESARGEETILLVEDEEVVRDLALEILHTDGYRVITADHGQEAVRIFDSLAGDVDLLLTDVVMPVMGGPELARLLTGRRKDLKVLYMSGYSGEVAFHDGLVEIRASFLAKPFTPDELITKVRSVLESSVTPLRA